MGTLSTVGEIVLVVIIVLVVLSIFTPGLFGAVKKVFQIGGQQTGITPILPPSIGGNNGDNSGSSSSCGVDVSTCQLDVRTDSPSMTVDQIKKVLVDAKSPAISNEPDVAQTFYDESKQTGIDDAVAIAFFQHESTFGTAGDTKTTKNMGNIRYTDLCSSKYGGKNYKGFCAYPTWKEGIIAWYNLIKDGYIDNLHLTTLGPILATYAPCGDNNNLQNYMASVKNFVSQYGRDVSSCQLS